MRKVSSKGALQPNNSGNASQIGMSPSTIKPHSMIKLYKGQTSATAAATQPTKNVSIQPSTLIAKTIQSRRQQQQVMSNTNQPSSLQNRTNQNITMLIGSEQNNNSVQSVKPTQVFSPGDTIQRKNLDLSHNGSGVIAHQPKSNHYYHQHQQQSNSSAQTHQFQMTMTMTTLGQSDKSSPLLRQKLFANGQYNQSEYNSVGAAGNRTTELYQNMKKQLEKQKSLQTLFNSTQKLQAQSSHRSLHQISQHTSLQQGQQPTVLSHVALQAKTSRNHLQQASTIESKSQRDVIRRGSKYQQNLTTGFILGTGTSYHSNQNSMINNSNLLNNSQRSAASNNQRALGHQSAVNIGLGAQQSASHQTAAVQQSNSLGGGGGGQQQIFMFKNNLGSLTRNRSAFINLNQTQSNERKNSVGAIANAYHTHQQQQQHNREVNKTQVNFNSQVQEVKALPLNLIKSKIMIHKESPSVSSDEESSKQDASKQVKPTADTRLKDFNANVSTQKLISMKSEVQRVAKQNLVFHQKKRSQLPNGSFIDTKMKNCLHSRNANAADPSAQAQAYQTYQASTHQRMLLTKNQSQPNLAQTQQGVRNQMNLTQRTTFVKSSFLRHDETRSVTPINQTQSKSPNPHSFKEEKASTKSKSKTKPVLVGLKGDMKSLNLSPIVPQNLGKHRPQFQREPSNSEYQNQQKRGGGDGQSSSNIASASKRLEMRKHSFNSNNNQSYTVQAQSQAQVPQNLGKQFGSMKKDRSMVELMSKQNTSSMKEEPTTEKKNNDNKNSKTTVVDNNNSKYKPGYSSQETERGPGGTNSYSTADDINLISNESHSGFNFRFKNDPGSHGRKMFQSDKSKLYQQPQFTDTMNIQDDAQHQVMRCLPLTQNCLFNKTHESKIKVNQILSNNNLSHTYSSNRYNLNITPDQITIAPDNYVKTSQATNTNMSSKVVLNKQKSADAHYYAQQVNNQTPRAIPTLEDNINHHQHHQQQQQPVFIEQQQQRSVKTQQARAAIDEQLTQKKKSKYVLEEKDSDSSFEDDYVDEKDFEEFDKAERSHDSHNSLKVRVQIIEQDSLFREQYQPQPPTALAMGEDSSKAAMYHYHPPPPKMHTEMNTNTYNQAAQALAHHQFYPPPNYYSGNNNNAKDDRNSLVNYDTSLLTHTTGRDNNSSPISDTRGANRHTSKNAPTSHHNSKKQQKNAHKAHQQTNNKHKQFEYKHQQKVHKQTTTTRIQENNSFLVPSQIDQDAGDQTLDFIRPSTLNQRENDDNIFEVCSAQQNQQQQQIDSATQRYKMLMYQLQQEEEQEIERVTQYIIGSNRYKIIKNDKERAKYLSTQLAVIRNKYKQLLIDRMFAEES